MELSRAETRRDDESRGPAGKKKGAKGKEKTEKVDVIPISASHGIGESRFGAGHPNRRSSLSRSF